MYTYNYNYKTEKETKTKQSKQRKVNKKEVSAIVLYTKPFSFLYCTLIFSLLHCKKDSPQAVRKSSYRHPSILSLSLTIFFFWLIIQINSFFCFSRKRYCDCSLSLPFFLFISFFSIVVVFYSIACAN